MTLEQDRQLLARLGEQQADEVSIVAGLKAIHDLCIRGYETEKVAGSQKIELTERLPETARKALVDIYNIYENVRERIDKAKDDPVTEFILNVGLLTTHTEADGH